MPKQDEPAPVLELRRSASALWCTPGADLGMRSGGSAQIRMGVPLTVCCAFLLPTRVQCHKHLLVLTGALPRWLALLLQGPACPWPQ